MSATIAWQHLDRVLQPGEQDGEEAGSAQVRMGLHPKGGHGLSLKVRGWQLGPLGGSVEVGGNPEEVGPGEGDEVLGAPPTCMG
jgi:hypothetical protein